MTLLHKVLSLNFVNAPLKKKKFHCLNFQDCSAKEEEKSMIEKDINISSKKFYE